MMIPFPDFPTSYPISNPVKGTMEHFKLEDLKKQLSPLASKMIKNEILNDILTGSKEHLSLEKLPINDQDLKILLSYCPQLTSLDLSEATFLSNSLIEALPPDKIQHLILRGLPNLTDDILTDLSSFHLLETLDLSENHFSLKNLYKIQSLIHLKKLALWRCQQLTNDNIAWVKHKNFDHLDISYCRSLTDECLSSLTQIANLDLDGINFITTKGLNDHLSSSTHLKQVSIEKCPHIEQSDLLPSLRDKVRKF